MADYTGHGHSVHLGATMRIFCIQISAPNAYFNWLFVQEWYLPNPPFNFIVQNLIHWIWNNFCWTCIANKSKYDKASLALFWKILQSFHICSHFYSLVKLYLSWRGHWQQVEQGSWQICGANQMRFHLPLLLVPLVSCLGQALDISYRYSLWKARILIYLQMPMMLSILMTII